MEHKFLRVRTELDSLGYFHSFGPESVNLVGKLLEDLKTTTASLQKYMKIAQNAIREKENLEVVSEPCRTNNSKLLKECNDLHLTLTGYRSQSEKELRELRERVLNLTDQNSKLSSDNEKLRSSLRRTELELMKLGPAVKKPSVVTKTRTQNNQPLHDDSLLKENLEIKRQLDELKKDFKNLQTKCESTEISKIDHALSDGEHEFTKKTFGFKNAEDKFLRLQDEIHALSREKCELERNYKDALAKQHEAMKRAIHLAERNKELEKELKDIDQMAIAVEEQCNDKVKDKNQKLTKVETALKDALTEVQTLEKTIASIKKEKHDSELNNEILRTEKKRLKEIVEETVKEKNEINEQLNNLKLIEHDLNMEIDRLATENSKQKRIIADIEGKLTIAQLTSRPTQGPGGDYTIIASALVKGKKETPECLCRTPKKEICGISIPSSTAGICTHPLRPQLTCSCDAANQTKCCMERETLTEAFRSGCVHNMCLRHFQDLLRKEIQQCQCEIQHTLLKVTQERDHYMEEYHKLINQVCDMQKQNMDCSVNSCYECSKAQQIVNFLQQENQMLSKEKIALMARLESTRNDGEIMGKCAKSTCKRTQRERDLFKADVKRLEEECDSLRDNIKTLCETKTREHDTFTQQIFDYESRLKKIEGERGELMNAQGLRRAQIGSLEEKNELLKRMLRGAQDDLQNQKLLYTQLKTLHDQTDKALHDVQAQLAQVEKEFEEALHTIEVLRAPYKEGTTCYCAEVDLDTMKRQLNRMDRDKDDLLNIVDSKTEEIANLKHDLKCKCELIGGLTDENTQLKERLGNITDRASASGAYLKETQAEVCRLQKCLQTAMKTRDDALEVNRKLQEELAVITREACGYKMGMTESQEQIENLKLQSQQYIAEVKKCEDLLQNKEKEREDLLNQFKQLCKETNNLQSSNHVLESEASQRKVQLSVAMDHVNTLEQKSETLETLVSDYEKQIGLLTNQIAKFESERDQHNLYQERTEAELRSLRELCMKIDREKEQLRLQLLSREDPREKVAELQRKNDALAAKLADSSTKLANAEKFLDDARQDGAQVKITNEDCKGEIQFLKKKIVDLEQRLSAAQKEVDMYQEKALDYSNQIRDLRRKLTNERFHRSSKDDNERYPSL